LKLLTEVIGAEGSEYHNYTVIENKIVIKSAQSGRGGAEISAKYDKSCLVPYKTKLLGFLPYDVLHQKLYLVKGADKCISWTYKDENGKTVALVDMPYPDFAVIQRYFDASTIRSAGNITTKVETSIGLYILIIVAIVISVITLLVSGGVIHFH
jgi:hypothetical protein